MTAQQAAFSDPKSSRLGMYRTLVAGRASIPSFLYYELTQFFLANMAGLPGFGLRSVLYPGLFQERCKRLAVGRGVVLRRTKQISIGNSVMIDDGAALDVRGDEGEIALSDCVSIGRYTTLAAKDGAIRLSAGVNVGSYCRIATQSQVTIGESTLVAAYAYIGPGNHQAGDEDTPLIEQEMELKGGVTIGSHAWIGTRATILDGVTIGDRAIIGAHALVLDDVPAGAVAVGIPAKIIQQR